MARYLSTQYPNNKPTNQSGGKKGDKRKGEDSKPEEKDSNTGGTAGVQVEDTTTNEDSTVPSEKRSDQPMIKARKCSKLNTIKE